MVSSCLEKIDENSWKFHGFWSCFKLIWLVVTGTMEWIMTFPSYWAFHHPNWVSYFSEGLGAQPPTSHWKSITFSMNFIYDLNKCLSAFDINRCLYALFPSYAVPIPMASMAGFFEVTTLEIDLMDPERVEAVQSAAWCDGVETSWWYIATKIPWFIAGFNCGFRNHPQFKNILFFFDLSEHGVY